MPNLKSMNESFFIRANALDVAEILHYFDTRVGLRISKKTEIFREAMELLANSLREQPGYEPKEFKSRKEAILYIEKTLTENERTKPKVPVTEDLDPVQLLKSMKDKAGE